MEENNLEKQEVINEGLEEPTKEIIETAPAQEEKTENSADKKKNNNAIHWIIDALLLAAVAVLYILHFTGGAKKSTPAAPRIAEVGTGEVVYINIDSINEKYELVHILTDSIDAEKQKQAVVFQNRQKTLEQKAANFEKNYSSGSLTPQQAQYAQQSLQEESTRLQNDYAQALESLELRYQTALQTIADSLNAAAKRVNANHNASYIFSYQTGGQLLYADPAHDITIEVLDELNRSFKKKK